MVATWLAATAGAAALTTVPLGYNYYTGLALSFPVIWLLYSLAGCQLVLYVCLRLFVRLLEDAVQDPTRRALRRKRDAATSYAAWSALGEALDASQPRRRGGWADDLTDWTAQHFSWDFFGQLIADLRAARETGDVAGAVAALWQCLRKDVGGIFATDLFAHLHTGRPKKLVEEFVAEVAATLGWLGGRQDEGTLGAADGAAVRSLLDGTRTTLGRPALCLSGGGMMGLYHLGAVRALKDEGLLPEILSGASAGSLVAAFTCTRTDEELDRDLRPEVLQPKFVCCARPWPQRIKSLVKHGHMFDNAEWLELVKWFTCGDLTFREAYAKTGRTLCITLSTVTKNAPPILLNHKSAPHVLVRSAVVASASMVGLLGRARLLAKGPDGKVVALQQEYWDGSIAQDLPISALAEQLNCQFFVVSQCNPHLVNLGFDADGAPGRPCRWLPRRGGHLLAGIELYLRLDMILKMDFLKQVGAVTNWTAELMTQTTEGDTTIVPQVKLIDYLKVVEDPTMDDMLRYFQGGRSASYGSMAMMRLRQDIDRAVADCRAAFGKEAPDGEAGKGKASIGEHVPSSTSTAAPDARPDGGPPPGIEDEDEDDDDCWVPIVRSRKSLFKGNIDCGRISDGGRIRRGSLLG